MTESRKLKKIDAQIDLMRKRVKDSDDFKVKDDVFDKRALMNLYVLAKKGVIDTLGGAISTGKEANIFYALSNEGELAIKIYRINTSNFKAMQNYLLGDPRFGNIKGTKRAVISAWNRKEFRNLKRAEEAGVRVPHPIAMKENILVMELIGKDGMAAPQLKDVNLYPEDTKQIFDLLSDYVSLLYNKADLVHADLSEFNILYHDGGPVIIDMGQSVTLEHPMAKAFLKRDIFNLARHFKKKYKIGSEEEIWAKLRADQKT
ncbi:MAG: serine protein kinase RIO [Methanotrichaceae archaeon]